MKLLAAAFLCASFALSPAKQSGPSVDGPSNVREWCGESADWSATQTVGGAIVWTVGATLSYVPSSSPGASGVLWVFGSLSPLPNGAFLSLYMQTPYPCVATDPTTTIQIVNWLDAVAGWSHASIQKPSGPTWPEAIQAGVVALVVQ